MSEEITTTTTVIELPDLRSRIKAEDSKARSIAKKSLEHVIECGRLLIELKSRVNHGNWRHEARQLNMSPRTITNYMKIARKGNVAVLGKGVRDALRLLSIAENPPTSTPTTPVLPEPPAPSPRLQQITLEAEIVEPVAQATAPPQAPLETTVEAATASPAPSLIETSEGTLMEILVLLPRLRPAEITELHRVIESRWLKPQTQAAAR